MPDRPSAPVVEQRGALYEEAVRRASTDSAFRGRLTTAPRDTLDALAEEMELEARVPEDVSVEVVEQRTDRVLLVLPLASDPSEEAGPGSGQEELDEAALEHVTGGVFQGETERLGTLQGTGTLGKDAHGCPACPHPGFLMSFGSSIRGS